MRKIAKNIIAVCGHIGTHKYNWQPESERFAIGYRSSLLIYNIAITNFYFNRACFFAENLVYKYGRIYIYGLNKKNDKKVIRKLQDLNQVVTTQNWSGGFVTNARIFRKRIRNIKKKFSAVLGLSFDYQNYSLPREAKIIKVPSIGVVDSNANAEMFTYPIPTNSSNFGITRTLAYTFTLKIFKGISKRILARFRKKKNIIKSKKLKKKSKKKRIIRKYFKKIKKKIKKKRIILKRRLKKWSKKFKNRFLLFKKNIIRLTERKKEKDYIKHNGEWHLTLEAAFRQYSQIEKIRKLPKRKIKKFIKAKLQIQKDIRPKYKLPKLSHRELINKPRIKFINSSKKTKSTYLRIRKKVRRRIAIRKKFNRIQKKKINKVEKKKVTKYKKKIIKHKKKNRFRPNKKWFKFKPNRFRIKKKKKLLSRFGRLKKKIFKLSKIKIFNKIIKKERKFKNPKFIYRFLKKAVHKYKIRKIYKFLYKKKKKLILKRTIDRGRRASNKKYYYRNRRYQEYHHRSENYNTPKKHNKNYELNKESNLKYEQDKKINKYNYSKTKNYSKNYWHYNANNGPTYTKKKRIKKENFRF
jgi:ribosomal protein S2